MPIYEYRCPECGQVFERFVRSANSDETVVCPGCGCKNPERLMSAFSSAGGSGSTGVSASSCGPSGFS